jgi:hypothetical protein
MEPENTLYCTVVDIPLMGRTRDGHPARAVIPAGTPAVKVRDHLGQEAVLAEGAIVPIKWDSPTFRVLFSEA